MYSKKRKRTPADDAWLDAMRSQALQHLDITKPSASDRTDLAVLERVSWLCSCNDARAFYGSVDGLAVNRRMARSTVQRSMSRWEARCVFEFAHRKGGRPSQSSRGRFNVLVLKPGQNDRVNPVKMTTRSKSTYRKEGQERSNSLDFPESEVSKRRRRVVLPVPVEGVAQSKADTKDTVQSLDLPSQEKAEAPVEFDHPKQVSMLFALQRKLGYEVNDEQAVVFDGLEHVDKKRIIDKLEAEEQRRAIRGEVANPPPKAPAPRHTPVERPTPTRERTACAQHRWSVPASDGVSQCNACGEEHGEIRVVLGGVR